MSLLDNADNLIQETDMRDYIKQLEQKVKYLEDYIEILKLENRSNYEYAKYMADNMKNQIWGQL